MKLKRIISSASVLFIALGVSLAGLQAAYATPEGAFAGIGRCLQSQGKEKTLDIFYLIDESASLLETDKDAKRADILNASLIQLGSFRKDVQVNYAVGFFGDKYSTWRTWTTLNPNSVVSEASKLEKEVRNRNQGKATNWLIGIEGATKELSAQHERTNGCSTLIWLTDGGINVNDNVSQTNNAYDELCGSSLNNLRSLNIPVLGILLKDQKYLDALSSDSRKNQLYSMSLMKPLVEGQGELSDGSPLTCGTYPIPKNYSEGGIFIAENANLLAYEFMKLPPQIQGCKNLNTTTNGQLQFNAEQGISDFQIVSMSDSWTLKSPKGQSFGNTSKDIDVYESTGVSQIRVPINQANVGKWSFSGASAKSTLFVCSGLDISINEGVELIAGKPGKLSGQVILQSNKLPADLSIYDKDHPITVEQIGGDGSYTQPVEATQSGKSDFSIENFVPTPGQTNLEIRVTLYLKTKSGLALNPISVSKNLEVRLPSNYPSLKTNPINLSDLQPTKQKLAKGEIVIDGPVGTDGKVCIDKNVTLKIVADAVSRNDQYSVQTSGLDANGCIRVTSSEQAKIGLTVDNPVTAKSDVKALLPITYYSDAEPDKKFTLDAKVNFKTLPPPTGPWEPILFALGVIIPLVLIQLMNFLTTKIAFGRQVQRASFEVLVNSNDRYTDRSGAAIQPAALDFKPRPEQPDVRSFEDPIGKFNTRLSKLVFPAPWFEVKAQDGFRIVTLVHAPPQLRKRFKSGKIAPIPGDMGKIWALKISDDALKNFDKSTPIAGSLVMFKRNNNSKPNQFSDVFNSITTKAGIWNEITRLSDVVKSESEATSKKSRRNGGDSGTGTTPPAPPSRPGSGRPGSSVQPGAGSVRPGSTSVRPGTTSSPGIPPTQRPGSANPRPGSGNPRPGSSTPPRV